MRHGVLLAGAVAFGTVLAPAPATASLFTFGDRIGALTDFSIASGTLTATFSSGSGPATFAVAEPAGLYSFPVALGDYGNFQGDPLTITFSDPVMDRILIPFGIEEAFATVPATLTVRANTAQTVVFTTAFNDLVSGAPEGAVSFVPVSPITSITLMSSMAYAIASVDLPEPNSALLLGAGLVAVIGLRRRRPKAQGRISARIENASVWVRSLRVTGAANTGSRIAGSAASTGISRAACVD